MNGKTKTCKVCGKEYEVCGASFKSGENRWQDVACCQSHAEEYFRAVLAARAGSAPVKAEPDMVVPEEAEPVDLTDDSGRDEKPAEKKRKKKPYDGQ